jgi:endonuclease/exonuclease/phosphatase family metal-dependent hydrolase
LEVATGLNPPLQNPANTFNAWNFPILNIDYILVNEPSNINTK